MTGDEMVEWNHRLNGSMSLSKFWELMKDREAWRAVVMGSQRVRHDLATEQQLYIVLEITGM